MEYLQEIKNYLEKKVYEEMTSDFKNIKTCELGEVIDMIKDLSEAMYHIQVVKAMENGEKNVTMTTNINTI